MKLTINDLTKTYKNGVKAIDNLNLEIAYATENSTILAHISVLYLESFV